MRHSGKSKTRGNTHKRPNASCAVERGSLALGQFGESNLTIGCRIDGLFGKENASDRKPGFRISAVADLVA